MIGTVVVVMAIVLAAALLAVPFALWAVDRSLGRQHATLTEKDVARGLDYETRRYVERVGREENR
jgi:type II secretory pathway pseudopilin PulG